MRTIRGSFSTVTISADGSTATKRFRTAANRRYGYELRVNRLLARHPPPVPRPGLVGVNRRRRELIFEALDGEPLGPKYPLALADDDIDAMVELALTTSAYSHRPRWLRRTPTARHVPAANALLRELPALRSRPWVFAHGDITARNAMRSRSGQLALIDWEWAGVYPRGWELAFVWYSLIDVPGARDRVGRAVPAADVDSFWASALVITVMHLGLGSIPDSFRPAHERTVDELASRVLGPTETRRVARLLT